MNSQQHTFVHLYHYWASLILSLALWVLTFGLVVGHNMIGEELINNEFGDINGLPGNADHWYQR